MVSFAEERHPKGRRHAIALVTVLTLFAAGCGPTDYEKPIHDFGRASAIVIVAANDFYCNYNFLETRNSLTQTATMGQEIKLKPTEDRLMTVDVPMVIPPEAIEVRTKALKVLSKYIQNLAELASGKPGEAIGKETAALSKTLDQTVSDAKKLADLVNPDTNHAFISNSKFASLASPVASAIGAVAQMIINHKARREIEQSLAQQEESVKALMDLLSREMGLIYERQKSNLRLNQMLASQIYNEAVKEKKGLAERVSAADLIANGERETQLLQAADPQPAVDKMKATFEALVAYAKSDKNPKTIADLFATVQDFVSEAGPLGDASHGLVTALQ